MYKSSKRIKLEREIFSKSIKDIERMFNFSCNEHKEDLRRKVPSNNSSTNDSATTNFSRLDLPAGTGLLHETTFKYDCINPSLMLSDTKSIAGELDQAIKPPMLPLSSLIPGRLPQLPIESHPRTVLLDLHDDDDVDDYKFELDLKLYLPRLNLENDLNMIDQMFMRPLHLC